MSLLTLNWINRSRIVKGDSVRTKKRIDKLRIKLSLLSNSNAKSQIIQNASNQLVRQSVNEAVVFRFLFNKRRLDFEAAQKRAIETSQSAAGMRLDAYLDRAHESDCRRHIVSITDRNFGQTRHRHRCRHQSPRFTQFHCLEKFDRKSQFNRNVFITLATTAKTKLFNCSYEITSRG